MSRSFKKSILKDRPRRHKKSSLYWRTIRRVLKNKIKSYGPIEAHISWDDGRYGSDEYGEMTFTGIIPKDTLDLEDTLPDPKSIVNDYDYCDYTIDYEYGEFRPHCPWVWKPGEIENYIKKLKRK